MSRARELPHRVVVAGDGQVGLLAAIALRRALPASEIFVLGTPPDPAALADRAATALPFTNRLHDRLGIAEERLVREVGASHRLAVRYQGWGGAEQRGVVAYGTAIDPSLCTRFAKEWGGGPRSASMGGVPGSLGELLAIEGRFCPPTGDVASLLEDLDYALRWNPPAYRDLLVSEARRIGVRHGRAAITGIEPDGEGGIRAIGVEGAGPVPADLFVDCTGPRALLLSQLPQARLEAWDRFLPIRALLVGQSGEPVVTLSDGIELAPVGWRSELGGRDGRQAVVGLTDHVTEEDARRALGSEPVGLIPIEAGCAARPWLGNVVALGDAAAHFEPLAWLNLDLAHRQLALLLELFPGRRPDPLERAEFNRRAGLMATRVLELLGAHYAAPTSAARFPGLQRAEGLELALDQYARRGRLPFLEEAPLQVQEFSALLHALGYPAGEGALAVAADPRDTERARFAFAARAKAALEAVPPYPDWLGQVLRS